MSRSRALIKKLRHEVEALRKLGDADRSWYGNARELVLAVFELRSDLESRYWELWRSETITVDSTHTTYLNSLEQIIRDLNRTDEVSYMNNPVFVLSVCGGIFLFLLTGGAYLYYILITK